MLDAVADDLCPVACNGDICLALRGLIDSRLHFQMRMLLHGMKGMMNRFDLIDKMVHGRNGNKLVAVKTRDKISFEGIHKGGCEALYHKVSVLETVFFVIGFKVYDIKENKGIGLIIHVHGNHKLLRAVPETHHIGKTREGIRIFLVIDIVESVTVIVFF